MRPRALATCNQKQCTGCTLMKPLEQFGLHKNGVKGRASQCRSCRSEDRRTKPRVRLCDMDPERAERLRRSRKNAVFLKAYGITLDRFEEMVAEQDGKCFLCRRPPSGTTPSSSVLYMDHDHTTGKPRRPLCHDCNTSLGRFGDDPDLMERGAAYLRSFR
jgi:hypothetical protein